MKGRLGIRLAAAVAASALVLTACSGDSDDTTDDSTSSATEIVEGDPSAIITANGTEPQNALIPTNTNETGGGKIIDLLFAGLVYYQADGTAANDMAESIETEDSQNYTIKIREGATFSNGDEVKAENFVEAWQYGALLSNAQLSSYFFEDIAGFSWEEDSELALEVVDDYTFTVELVEPIADFPQRLGYSAYYPLPMSAFDDMDAFGKNPIGNGPYMFDGDDAWKNNESISLITNPDYDGPRAPMNGGVNFTLYQSFDAAYFDLLAGNLDVMDEMPDSAYATFEDELDGRSVNQPAAIFQSFTIPDRLDHFGGEEGVLRRQAISLSINRQEITDVIFEGTRSPAQDFTSPVVSGWSDSIEGNDILEYDPDRAKDLWAQANEISEWEGTFEIGYNSDGPHQAWVDATVNSIKNTLEIDAVGTPYPTFAEFRTLITERQIDTAFRTGWQADYPGLYNFLGPLYATGAGSNDGDYSSEDFDSLLAEAKVIEDETERNEKLQEAQEVLFADLPAIPLWYANVTGGYGEGVNNVEFGWNSVPLYYQISK